MLFREYHAELAPELQHAEFEREVEGLPGRYASPVGALLLASVEGQPAGCVGLRPYPQLERACEMKRLYVRAAFRKHKLGLLLVQAIEEARKRGYERLRLDTHPPTMQSAVALYERLKFTVVTEVANAMSGLVYMELKL